MVLEVQLKGWNLLMASLLTEFQDGASNHMTIAGSVHIYIVSLLMSPPLLLKAAGFSHANATPKTLSNPKCLPKAPPFNIRGGLSFHTHNPSRWRLNFNTWTLGNTLQFQHSKSLGDTLQHSQIVIMPLSCTMHYVNIYYFSNKSSEEHLPKTLQISLHLLKIHALS